MNYQSSFGSGTVSGPAAQSGASGSQFVLSNSAAIRAEIHRFESVHPNIYAIYDLVERIDDLALQNQIREHVISIEDSFVNSQEWTLSRSVPELKVGIVGNLSSGKSALVHRYLTGTYVQEESPEGGRFKKEIVVDGQSYLLLIRDEGGPPELQFILMYSVVFVFSLEDEISFQTVYNYFLRLSSYRNTAEVPMVLVGTQDAISAANPRVIDDARARKLSNDLKRSTYYETCSTYGLNVERVFQDVAQKVVALRKKQQLSTGPCKSLPNSPSHSSVPSASIPSVHINQVRGAFSDYSSSVPSTPSISQREMRIETVAASNTPTPIRKQSKRRSNIFTVSMSEREFQLMTF
uniref:ArfGAP with GTPase domain, ankyrin repeat and PH domain 3 n=1 Tax=Sinocyclocheilus anshuiensis TaxID=1608454 RepID=A0A671NIS4_9TELE